MFGSYANSPDLVSLPLGRGQVVGFGVAGAASVPGAADGSTVDYAGALPDSSVEFTAGTGMVKEQLVLASPGAPTTWVFPLHLTGLHAEMGRGGIVQFADAAGKVVAYVPPGLMTDSNIDPHSGDGAMSAGVSYSLVKAGGQPAIKMTLDAAWLGSAARVYPVTVDPSVTSVNANGTTYVQSPDNSDFSGDNEIHVGTWDGGSDMAESYLAFGNVASQLKNDTVLGVRLGVFNTWSYSCSPRAVYAYPVTSSWSVTGAKSWSTRPSTGAAVGRASFATGWVPLGSTSSPCPASWKGINLDQAGTNLVNGWTHGTVADNGLALGASDSDSYAWKKFASDASGTGDPFLAVTYTTDGASYKLASSRPVTPVTPTQDGKFAVRVTNTGSSTWTTSNGYEISYEAYDSKKQLVANHPVFTPMPSTVAPGQTVTIDVTVAALPVGSYAINFDMYSGATGSSPVSFKSQGIQPYAIGLFVPEPSPVVSAVYPPTGYVSTTLRQQLSTTATATGTITYSFKLTCEPVTGQTCVDATISSGTISNPYWTPPAADLQWNTQYQWTVTVTGTSSGSSTSTTVGPVEIMAQVPQPNITTSLGGTSGQAYDPLSGNYTTSATDAAVASVGPPLRIVRTYNSMDPRTAGAFGAGWSSVLDTALRPDNDGSGSVVVTLPSGQQMRFGQNGNGSYAAPFGSSDVLVHNSSGTWTLRDASGNEYAFTSAGLLSQIIDRSGLSQSFTDNSSGGVTTVANAASGRTLTIAWSKPTGAAYSHVQSVTTQAPAAGQPGYTWTYSYSGDKLTGACAPATTGTGCTAYSYSSGSHYRAGVLDSGPRDYWQLGEASGTTAADEAETNLGTTDGTYSNVTLGVAGPLSGSSETAAGFNGSSSSVSLPSDLITDSTDVTIELWFKAASSTASGVLFSYEAQPPSKATGNHEPVLYVGGNGELYGEFWNGSVDPVHTSSSVDDGKWHYVVLTAASTTQSMYLDGALVGSVSGQINNLNMTVDTIGAGYWTSWPQNTEGGATTTVGYFNGDIAQVAVYPHPIGAPAVGTHHALATGGSAELSQVTLPSGNVYEQASYDSATGRLSSYTDPNGGQWTIGQPIATGQKTSSDALGEVIDNVSVTDPAGRQETYSYDMLDGGRLVAFDNGVDPMEVYGYDAAGFLTSVTDQDGNLVCFTNDAHGNMLTRTWYPIEPAGLPGVSTGVAAACGGSSSSSPSCTSSGAACTTFYGYGSYDSANPLDPKNSELTSVRDGRSASVNDSTYLTRYSYNAAGQLISQITPNTTDFPAGRTTTYGYSTGSEAAYGGGTVPAGLLLAQVTPGGALTGYQYYSDGDLAKVTEPSGAYTIYTYDALGRPLTSTVYTSSFPSGEMTSYTYDGLGHQLTVTYPAVTNNVVAPPVTHQLEDAYAYDADGNLLSLTQSDLTGGDAPRTTSYTYNDHDETATKTQPAGATPGTGSAPSQGAPSANPQGATTSYDYDGFGNITQRTDPNGNVYRYGYNEYQEPTQVELYTSSTSASAPTAGCTVPAVQDSDGGCDLVLDSYAYDPAGLLAATTDAMGRITNNTYDHNQDLIAVTTTDPSTSPTTGRQTTYSYDGAGNLIGQSVSAMSGGSVGTTTVTNYTVDAADRLTSQVQDATPSGGSGSYLNRTISYTYNADNHVLSQTTGTAAEGGTSVTDYGYDTIGDLTSQTVQDGSTSLKTTWTYDQNGQPLSMTTPAGNAAGATAANYTTNYAYDPAWNLVTVTGPPIATQTYSAQTPATTRPVTRYGYDTFGDQTQVEDPDSNITVTGYDGDGRITSVTGPSYTPPGSQTAIAPTTSYAYDEVGNLVRRTDPENNVTAYGYDALGDLTSMTEPQLPGQSAPGVWQYSYDAAGERLSAADPLGNTTHATYDYFGDQVTSTDALGNTTKYTYDYLGDRTSVTTPDGADTSQTFDRLGELTASANAYGDTSKYAYDDQGRLADADNPDGSFTQYGYDQAGDLTSAANYGTAPAGQAAPELRSASFGYDPNDDVTSAKSWNGNTTSYAYNAVGELTSQVQPVSSSASITTSYGYDQAGNQTAVTGGNGNTTWTTYNSWNQPESVIEPATPTAPSAGQRTWTTAYNANGQPATVTQPGGITLSDAYDPLGHITSQTGSGASAPTTARSFGYDLDGRMTSASAPGGTDSFSYNADSALTGTSGPSGTSSFSYNGDGLVSSETDPAGTTGYTYDSADRLATESEPLTGSTLTLAYNASSLPTSISYASGGAAGPVQSFTYDGLDRLATDKVTGASGGTLASETYAYDADGNLTSQATGGLMSAGTTSYAYDEADRLTSATAGGTSTSYAYDGDGNLTQSGATSFAYNAQDQVTSATTASGTTSYGYTLSGALASVTPPGGSAQQYTSDAFGQQTTAPGGVSYGYDALGRTVTRTVGASTTPMAYLGTGSTLASDGSYHYTYAPSGQLTAAATIGGSAFVTMNDQHGDLAATFSPTSTAAGLAGYATYSPYGTRSATGYKPNLGFQGNYTDPATGQVDMGARWYNPATGGFTTNDTMGGSPISTTIDHNPYAYTNGDPLTGTDPTGHCQPVPIGIGIGWGCGTGTGTGIGIGIGGQGGSQGGTSSDQLGLGSGWWQQLGQGQQQNTDPGWQWQMYEWALQHGYSPWPAPQAAAAPRPGAGGCSYNCGGGDYPVGGLPGCVDNCTSAPPPPPPPQDCYAGPDPACVPPPAPGSLRTDILITQQASDITSFQQLLRDHRAIIEQPVRGKPQPVKGTQPSDTTNGSPDGNDGSTNIATLLQPIRDLYPLIPPAPTPGNAGNKEIRKLAKQVANVAVPAIQAVAQLIPDAIESTASTAASCVTHPALSSCAQTAATIAGFALGAGGDVTALDAADVTAAEDASVTEAAATACGGMSFTAGTKVLLADGKKKPIASLKRGDKVLATSTKTGKTAAEPVRAVLVHHDRNLYDLKVRTGHRTAVIHTTSNHLFWVPYLHYGWIRADHLKPGMHLKTPDGQSAVVVGGSVPAVHGGWMWDLTVPGNNDHDFYVLAGYTPVLVHNASCPTGFDYEAASQSGMRADRNGLTRAGREYQKHMGRGELPTVGGRGLDSAGQDLLDGILTDPSADYQPVTGGAFSGGYRVIGNNLVNGRFVGATFDSSGNFQYFGLYP